MKQNQAYQKPSTSGNAAATSANRLKHTSTFVIKDNDDEPVLQPPFPKRRAALVRPLRVASPIAFPLKR